jgi:hypothetical protein
MKISTIRNIFLALLFTSVQSFATTADDARVTEALETLRLAINAHDYALLEPSLDDRFTYEGRSSLMSTMIMKQVVNGFPMEVSAITVISIAPLEDGWDVAVRLEGKEPSKERIVTLTNDYLIRQADIADIQVAGHG